MLKNQLRRDLRWLNRQARKDRRITAGLLAFAVAAWTRQLPAWDAPVGADILLALSLGLIAGSAMAWLASAYLVAMSAGTWKDPVEELRRISRITRAKERALWSVGAYVAWHTLQFVTALVLG
ncbi:MAG TPA: hypothetical protein VFV66_15175 [Nonomuraea sp.]|nr:hypothetical protein [Nonomuraea sp.]